MAATNRISRCRDAKPIRVRKVEKSRNIGYQHRSPIEPLY
jgi:hypothetical protein